MNAAALTHSVSLQDLNLSVRTTSMLSRGAAPRPSTISIGLARIRKLDGIGPCSLSELKDAMELLGVSIAESPARARKETPGEKAASARLPGAKAKPMRSLRKMYGKKSSSLLRELIA